MSLKKIALSLLVTVAIITFASIIDKQSDVNAENIKIENIKKEDLLFFKVNRVYEIMEKNHKERVAKENLEEEKRIAEEKKEFEDSKEYFEFEVSFYDSDYACTQNGNGVTTSGEYAIEGVTIAAPDDIPFGSKIYIEGLGEYTVQDRGGYITYDKNVMRVDVYVSTHEKALELGRFNANGYVIRNND